MNVASGCPLFANHSQIEQLLYLKDDCVFIKVTVDTTDLRLFALRTTLAVGNVSLP